MDFVEKSLGLRVEKEKKGKRGKEEREAGKLVSYELNFLIFGSLNLILKQRWEREERRSSIFARILVVYIKIDKFNFRPFVTAEGILSLRRFCHQTILPDGNFAMDLISGRFRS